MKIALVLSTLLICLISSPAAADEVTTEDETNTESANAADWIAFPLVAYSPETSLLFAATSLFLFPVEGSIHPSRVSASAVYTLRDQATVIGETDWIFDDADWELSARIIASAWLLDYFESPSQETSTELDYYSLGGRIVGLRRLVSELYLGAGIDVQLREFTEEPEGAPVVAGETISMIQHRFELRWDTRDSRITPQSGLYAHAGLDFAPGYGGTTQSYWRWQADFRGYHSFGDHTFAARTVIEQNSASTPFFKQSTVGGTQRLRGVLRNRFRDDWSASQQVEYRSPQLVWRFGVAAFAGYGAVGGDGDIDHVASGGGGIRFLLMEDQNVSLRLDGGVSTTDRGVYLSIGEAF